MKEIQFPFKELGRKLMHNENICWPVHYKCNKTIKEHLIEIAKYRLVPLTLKKQAAHTH
jgi:hypothetical protein